MDTRKLNGTYRGKGIGGGLGETAGGKPQVVITCEIIADGEAKGVRLSWYGPFTEKTTESTIKGLRALGWKGTDISELIVENFPNTGLGNNEVDLVIEQEPAQDSQGNPVELPDGTVDTRARIRWVNAAGRVGPKNAMPVDKAKAFAASMKGMIVAFDQQNGAPKANGAPPSQRPSPPKGPAVDPGDVPF